MQSGNFQIIDTASGDVRLLQRVSERTHIKVKTDSTQWFLSPNQKLVDIQANDDQALIESFRREYDRIKHRVNQMQNQSDYFVQAIKLSDRINYLLKIDKRNDSFTIEDIDKGTNLGQLIKKSLPGKEFDLLTSFLEMKVDKGKSFTMNTLLPHGFEYKMISNLFMTTSDA